MARRLRAQPRRREILRDRRRIDGLPGAVVRPNKLVFIGTPYAALGEREVPDLRAFARDVDTLFIQQTGDPEGPSSGLSSALGHARDLADVPSDDHRYADAALVGTLVRRWRHVPADTS